ncbi:glycine-rich RNA-binding protein GRP1A-like [Homarus americanus]|uniref:glycine-rich RNA-binding protein GRP1A-like n=1 Tax=Homarus americanus TaxID=6706 RepID=UPI001C453E35|nr:glycine-rich RNA-binding protein GRP1A-like [Homarus americanus]
MLMCAMLLVVAAAHVSSTPLPDTSFEQGGFVPLIGGRGSGPSTGYSAPPPPASGYGAPRVHGGGAGPTKTIYVNVPHPEPPRPLPPIAAGPPRKHYKIVFIRAPAPRPPPQPILPPRTEQKTIIYVLHQRPLVHDQKVIQVPPTETHDPEVFFVQYDQPPSAQELQQLSSGNLEGFTVTAQAAEINAGRTGDDGVALGISSPGGGAVGGGYGSGGGSIGVGLPGLGSGVGQTGFSGVGSGIGGQSADDGFAGFDSFGPLDGASGFDNFFSGGSVDSDSYEDRLGVSA